MRPTFYILGILFTILAILGLFPIIATINIDFVGYGLETTFLFGGIMILTAAVYDYKGGLQFLSGAFILSICTLLAWFDYDNFLKEKTEFLKTGLIVTTIFLVLGFILIWLGHKRHKKLRALLAIQAADIEMTSANKLADETSNILYISDDKLPGAAPFALYPPMQTGKIFLLLIFSGMLYSIFLTYRIIKDLHDLGENKYRPKHDALKMLIPIYGFLVFLRMAQSIGKIAKSKGVINKVRPSTLVWLLVITGLSSFLIPRFLYPLQVTYPLTIFIATIPWLILHNQMNGLRLAYASNWREPANRFTWKQLSLLLIGIPFMGWVLFANKIYMPYFTADRLAAGQHISGQPSIYQFQIPDRNWKQAPTGTFYKDTDLELINKTMNEWVVVRVQPKQQQTLDNYVDQRRTIFAANLKELRIDETRTLNSGANLIPVSLAHFSGKEGVLHINQSFYVITVVTPELFVEVIGQESKNPGSTLQELMRSFRLTAKDSK
ncbi:MAG: hypothetical protein ABSB19_08180 [Methylomonas sp.]|jgi:hypothetical protein